MPVLTRARSMLFMPATRADMIAKIPRLGPDLAVADLEDAVPPDSKAAARQTAAAAISALDPAAWGPAVPTTVLVRVNPVGSPWFAGDVAAAAGSGAAGIVVPKLATQNDVHEIRQALARHSWAGAVIVAGIETALGVADARALLASGLSGAYFGAEDYIADIGGRRTPGGDEVLYARSAVGLAAHLAGIPAVDQAVLDLDDDGHFRADARRGQSLGYQGKICIHPRQVGLAHQAFTPAPDELEHARAVIAAAETGVAVVGGQMVDEVHVRMARATLARVPEPAGAGGPVDPPGPPGPLVRPVAPGTADPA
jgi:citrate lyase subunit beta / citryl-CoA lyase